jgi:hypothetical protein
MKKLIPAAFHGLAGRRVSVGSASLLPPRRHKPSLANGDSHHKHQPQSNSHRHRPIVNELCKEFFWNDVLKEYGKRMNLLLRSLLLIIALPPIDDTLQSIIIILKCCGFYQTQYVQGEAFLLASSVR